MKSILITGASGGMGSAAVKLFVEEGYRVFALDIKECEPSDGVIFVKADLTSEESVINAYENVRSYTDSLEGIIHFAGVYMLDSLVEMDTSDYRRIFDINLHGVYLINKIFLPLLSSKAGIIITTSELAVLDPLPFTGIYAVTKAALDKYAYSLRMELQLLGIRVSVIRAGAVKTDMLEVSTDSLCRFTEKTELYSCNAKRFQSIVNRVEARSIPSSLIAKKALYVFKRKNPRFAYAINRNPLLLLMNALPDRLAFFVIRRILRK